MEVLVQALPILGIQIFVISNQMMGAFKENLNLYLVWKLGGIHLYLYNLLWKMEVHRRVLA
jgi:hypothetical protein